MTWLTIAVVLLGLAVLSLCWILWFVASSLGAWVSAHEDRIDRLERLYTGVDDGS